MITAYVFVTSTDEESYRVGIVYEKDGKKVTERSISREDKEELGIHGGNIFGTIAAIFDSERIGRKLMDCEMTIVIDDEAVFGLEYGNDPDCIMASKLLDYIFKVSERMNITLSPPYQGMEEPYGRAKDLACA